MNGIIMYSRQNGGYNIRNHGKSEGENDSTIY